MSLGWIDGCRGAVPVISFFPMAPKPANRCAEAQEELKAKINRR